MKYLLLLSFLSVPLASQVISLLGYNPAVGYQPVALDGQTLLIDNSTGSPFLKCAISAGPAGPAGPQGKPGPQGPAGPAGAPGTGLPVQIRVAAPLFYDPVTNTISCPMCVSADATGSVKLVGGLTTGNGSSKPTCETKTDATGKTWYFTVTTSGAIQGSTTPCS